MPPLALPLRRAVALLLAALLASPAALAHHGWAWASEEQASLTGRITDVRLGNPHGELTLEVEGEDWVVEVGQPWRNERAGLSEELLAENRRITAHGHRSARPGERLLKAERLEIDGEDYILYPGRDSSAPR